MLHSSWQHVGANDGLQLTFGDGPLRTAASPGGNFAGAASDRDEWTWATDAASLASLRMIYTQLFDKDGSNSVSADELGRDPPPPPPPSAPTMVA